MTPSWWARVIAVGVGVLSASCRLPVESAGDEGALLVVVDKDERAAVEAPVNVAFGRRFETPQPEPWFAVSWCDASELAAFTRSPLILVCGTLSGSGPTAQLLKRTLSPDAAEGVQSGEYGVFRKQDPWARRQLLLILVGADLRQLASNARDWADTLAEWAADFERDRLTALMLKRGEQTRTAEDMRRRHGFSIRLQADFVLEQDNDSLRFVRYVRPRPERWVMVAWDSLGDPARWNALAMYERRKSVGRWFADPVIHYDDHWACDSVRWGARHVLRLIGLWATEGPIGGGPFITYGVAVPEQNRFYLIDGAVFAPGKAKMPFLWQVDAVCRTFSPALSEEVK